MLAIGAPVLIIISLVLSGISNEMDMERALKTAKRELAAKEGPQLAKQWEVQRAVGMYYCVVRKRCVEKGHGRQLSFRSRFVCRFVAIELTHELFLLIIPYHRLPVVQADGS